MTWDISPILFQIDSFSIRYYSLLFMLMAITGLWLFYQQMRAIGYHDELIFSFFIPLLLAVIIGSRAGHVIFYMPYEFIQDPLLLFRFRQGGMASHGAAIALILVLVFWSYKNKINFLIPMDCFALSIANAIVMVRIGNFFNSEIVGRITDVPWAIQFPLYQQDSLLIAIDVPARHPSQLYEALVGIFIFIFLLILDYKYKIRKYAGLKISLLLIIYFSCRFFLEQYKEYQFFTAETSQWTMGQILSIPFIILGCILLLTSYKRYYKQ